MTKNVTVLIVLIQDSSTSPKKIRFPMQKYFDEIIKSCSRVDTRGTKYLVYFITMLQHILSLCFLELLCVRYFAPEKWLLVAFFLTIVECNCGWLVVDTYQMMMIMMHIWKKEFLFLKSQHNIFLLCCREKVSSQKEFLIYSFGFTRIFDFAKKTWFLRVLAYSR